MDTLVKYIKPSLEPTLCHGAGAAGRGIPREGDDKSKANGKTQNAKVTGTTYTNFSVASVFSKIQHSEHGATLCSLCETPPSTEVTERFGGVIPICRHLAFRHLPFAFWFAFGSSPSSRPQPERISPLQGNPLWACPLPFSPRLMPWATLFRPSRRALGRVKPLS